MDVCVVAEPGSNPPDARLNDRQENGTSVESDSQVSGASTRKELRQHLADITDSVMLHATSILKKESKNCGVTNDADAKATQKFDVPVFDKSIDYVSKVRE